MATDSSLTIDTSTAKFSYNWPVVGFLLFLTGVPGIPAMFILFYIAMGAPPDGSDHGFVNMLHFATPMAVMVHGSAGILFFLVMPFQFSTALRKKYNRYHRLAGGITIVSGYTMALSAPWMHQVLSSDAGLPRYVGLLAMSGAMVIGFSLALHAIIRLNTKQHRAWMMRSVAIALVPITSELFEIPIDLIFGNVEQLYSEANRLNYSYGRWLGIAINLSITEYLLLRENRLTTMMTPRITK